MSLDALSALSPTLFLGAGNPLGSQSAMNLGVTGPQYAANVGQPIDTVPTVDPRELGAVTRATPSVEFLAVRLDGRQVGVLSAESPGVRDEWEMHPEQDELLYLLEGAIDVFLRADLEGSEEETLHFTRGQACLIPKGTWHRQVVVAPCKMLFLTPETIRAYTPESG